MIQIDSYIRVSCNPWLVWALALVECKGKARPFPNPYSLLAIKEKGVEKVVF